MTTISPNFVGVNFRASEQVKSKNVELNPKKDESQKGMSNMMKVGIGIGALATITIVGLAIRGKIKSNQIKNQIKKLTVEQKQLESSIGYSLSSQDERTKTLFDPVLMENHIESAKKLPLKEQVEKLRHINECAGVTYHDIFEAVYSPRGSNYDWDKPPKLSKEILETKDQCLIAEEYLKLMKNRTIDSKTQGKTIQETVENVFGANTTIKPHTYDLSKEYDSIGTQESIGGYKAFYATKDGKYYFLCKHTNPEGANGEVLSNSKFSIKKDILDQQGYGIDAQKYEGKPVVFMSLGENNIDNKEGLYLFSPNNEMTPMQKDLLSLNGKLTPDDISTYRDIFGKGHCNAEEQIVLRGDRNYDGIASFIQSMAEKYRK